MAKVVQLSDIPIQSVSSYDLRKIKKVLEKQGQIEPIVYRDNKVLSPWGQEIVEAARDLGWDTILITEYDKSSG